MKLSCRHYRYMTDWCELSKRDGRGCVKSPTQPLRPRSSIFFSVDFRILKKVQKHSNSTALLTVTAACCWRLGGGSIIIETGDFNYTKRRKLCTYVIAKHNMK